MTMTDPLPASRSSSPFKQAIVGGYDRDEVDEYVAQLERRLEALEQERTPDGAVQRRLEQVGDEVAGILQRAHETADQLTQSARAEAKQLLESARRESEELRQTSQREAEERLEAARREADERIGASHRDAAAITANSQTRLQELDVDADRIWAERERILADIRFLSRQLNEIVDAATERFPSEEAGDVTDEVAMLPGEFGSLPDEDEEGELAEAIEDEDAELGGAFPDDDGEVTGKIHDEDATQAFNVEELLGGAEPSGEDPLPGKPAHEASPEEPEGPELAGD